MHLVYVFQNNYVNVHNLKLADGRYYVCVFAKAKQIKFEKFTQQLPAVSACSNGITIDVMDPEPGQVWVGDHQRHRSYQVLVAYLSTIYNSTMHYFHHTIMIT